MADVGDARLALSAAPLYLAAPLAEVPVHDDWLTPDEADRLSSFRFTKRRQEARLGRWTAKRALAFALGAGSDPASLRDLVIRNASDGAPEAFVGEAPASVRISMTDRADWAVCTVLEVDGDGGVGCDLELIEPRSRRFVEDWFTGAERAFVASQASDHDLYANLIWSAKESALKVLRTGLRRDTRSVQVELVDATIDGWRRLSVTSVEGGVYAGWWRVFGDFVLTCVSTPSAGPPRSLVEPVPLEAAVPSHSWMDRPLEQTSRPR